MVQAQRTINVDVCDFCGEHTCYTKCKHCNRDICNDCKEIGGKYFSQSVYFRGSGDGYYCVDCLALPVVKTSPLFRAYQSILQLSLENEAYNKDFTERRKLAENKLSKLLEKENV